MQARFRHADRVLRRLSACGLAFLVAGLTAEAQEPPHSAALDRMIVEQAKRNGVPERLVRRIVMRESKYDPRARNHLYWGLMQISYPTARSMGFKGTPQELLNPLVNLTYAVPYLANAFITAGKREDEAVRLYAAGYYFTARQRGLLSQLRTADSTPLADLPDDVRAYASTAPQPQAGYGIFGAPQQQTPAPAAAPEQAPGQMARDTMASSDEVAMVVGRKGVLAPPRKWLRDGGTTQIARGEQGIENVAAYEAANGVKPARKSARHSRKSTEFASIDSTPPGAQAYASAEGQDPRFAQAPSQAAIAEATVPAPQAAPQPTAADQPPTSNAPPAKLAHKVARKSRRRGSDDGSTQMAKSDGRTDAKDEGADGTPTRRHAARHPKKSQDSAIVTAQHADDGALPQH